MLSPITLTRNNSQMLDGTSQIPKVFQVHGHRGFGIEKPENTMDAFNESVKMKLDYIETDVWLTSDEVPVIVHADTELGMCKMFDTETNTEKQIFITKTKYEDFSHQMYKKSGSVVPTLEEVVKLLKDSGTKINLEIKDWNTKVIALSQDVILKHDALDLMFFSSFVHKHSTTLRNELAKRKLKKEIGFGYLASNWSQVPHWDSMEIMPGKDLLIFDAEMFRHFPDQFAEAKKEAKKKGISMALYLDEEFYDLETDEFWDRCIENGIKDFITNKPSGCMDYKKRKTSTNDLSDLSSSENDNNYCKFEESSDSSNI